MPYLLLNQIKHRVEKIMICAQPWIELDFAAFTHNVTQYAQFIGPHRNLAVVVKSNAYGHGLLPIAQWCEQLDLIQWLCVAHLSEAITLRNEGITKPILVLYDLDVDPKLAVLNAIDVMVDTHEMLHFLNELGRGLGQKVHVHLKIDTGMHRLGFSSEEFIAIAPHLARYEGLNIRGIYSHFCEADNVESAYTLEQIQIFERLMTIASSYIPTLVYRHYANTSATLLHSLGSTNLVRVGAGIYGLWPSYELEEKIKTLHPHFSLQPVLSLKARIMRFKHVPEKRQ
jgi:alanine racemase